MPLFDLFGFVLFYLFIVMLAVSLGYHRFLAHKSFRARKWFEYLIVFLGLPAGTPVQWAGNHRAHHLYEDTPEDPHSPIHKGLMYAHTGWYLNTKNQWLALAYALGGPLRTVFDAFYRPRTNQQYNHLAKDIQGDSVFRFLSRPWPYTVAVLLHLSASVALATLWLGEQGWMVYWLLSIYVYNIGDAVNSFGHVYGDRPFSGDGKATDNKVLGILTFGDGWHAGHHCFPASARHGLSGQWDLAFQWITVFHRLGVISHFETVDPAKLEKRRRNS